VADHDAGTVARWLGLTMQNANTGITVAGHPLPTRPARSRAV
jgi:hypothetical protein